MLYRWQKAVREGRLEAALGTQGPGEAMSLAEAMRAVCNEDVCNNTYGRVQMCQALLRKDLFSLS